MEVRPLATDGIVCLDGKVLLLERNHEPEEGKWVLPGGFVEPDERARDACVREVNEEVGLAVETTEFVGLYDAPDRDPRDTVSAAYRCQPTEAAPEPAALEEASRIRTFDPASLPAMGFDHAQILRDAFENYAGRR